MALPKPDPEKYRGGELSRLYKEDLQAWQDSQDAEPEVGAVGEEEVVSLASTFDTEAAPFAPDTGAGSGVREEGDVTPPTYTSTPETQADFLNTVDIMRTQYGNRPLEDLWFAFEREYQYQPELLAQTKEDYMALSQGSQAGDFTDRLTAIGVSAEDMPEFGYGEDFDTFRDSLVSNEKDFYGVYDDKALENYSNIYSSLQGLEGSDFAQNYSNLDSGNKKIYLYEAFKAGNITEDQYQENMAGILASEGKQVIKDPNDGEYKYYREIGDGQYAFYKINLTPEDYYETFTTGGGQDTLWKNQGARDVVNEANRLGVDVDKRKEVAFLEQGIGSFGEDDTVRQTTSEFFTSGILDNPLTQIVAAMTGVSGPLNALRAGVKVVNGDTLHGEDWAALTLNALETLDVIKPPTKFDTAGTGIGGLDYNQTVNAINAMGSGDPVDVLMDTWGNDIVNDALADVGLDLDDLPQGVKEGINETVNGMLSGDSFEEAAQEGVLTYLEESPIGEVVEDKIKEVGSTIDDDVIQPLLSVIPELDVEVPDLGVVEDVVRDIGSAIDDTVLQPIKDEVEKLGEALPDIPDLPELPELPELPDLPLPDLKLGIDVQIPQLSATRTTDGLFGDELFKFKTKLGVTEAAPLIQPQERLAEQQEQQVEREEAVDLFGRDPFASSFNRNIV